MSLSGSIIFQDANLSVMGNLVIFHDHAMIIIMMILILIIYMLFFMIYNKFIDCKMIESQVIEILWTFVPMVLLMFLAIPSLKILYLSDEVYKPYLTIKVLGHQWYWSYEYTDFKDLMFDSFMLNKSNNSLFRLLDVDNSFVLPMNLNIRIMISSVDVIHSFTVPSIGVKVDAIPGRINQIMMNLNRPGLFYGQCLEICGVNHSFMPIVLECNNLESFLNWIYYM